MTGPVRRVAVVTGGAGAIGASIAAALTAAGHQVVILDRTGELPVDLADDQRCGTARLALESRKRRGGGYARGPAVQDRG
jgi:NAD(P)-dependent dehydrogenase (short-subunit alcohol dehydrogenase family)